MGDLSKNFSRHEFACKGQRCCCGTAAVDSRLIDALQLFRDKMGVSLHVNSGFRCNTHNGNIGSSSTSQHPKGTAADISIPEGFTADQMEQIAETIGAFQHGGIGKYNSFVHLDVRKDGPARWDYRT